MGNEDTRNAPDRTQPVRHAGMVVAVEVDAGNRNVAIQTLRSDGALDIERAEGKIVDGDWVDFDPVSPPLLVN